jgi:predicted DNA-binding transcriptional regulator YafY
VNDKYELVEPLRDEKAQRLINLVLLLRSSVKGYTKTEIFQRISGYQNSANLDTVSTMFERDKAELAKAGIKLEVYQANAYSEDEFRYRLQDESALLPEISLSSDEVKAVSAALAIWRDTLHKSAALQAQLKLEGLGSLLSNDIPAIDISGNEHLPNLLLAIDQKKLVEFEYFKPQAAEAMTRKLEPWGVLNRNGQWFLYGFDVMRKADRVFNLSRIQGAVTLKGNAGAFEIPDSIDFSGLFKPHFNQTEATSVTLRLAEGAGMHWRRMANVDTSELNPTTVTCTLLNPAVEIPRLAAEAPEVVVEAPLDIRNRVRNLIFGGEK